MIQLLDSRKATTQSKQACIVFGSIKDLYDGVNADAWTIHVKTEINTAIALGETITEKTLKVIAPCVLWR